MSDPTQPLYVTQNYLGMYKVRLPVICVLKLDSSITDVTQTTIPISTPS